MMDKTDVVQLAYILKPGGLDAALDFWINVMGAGPFYRGVFPLAEQVHKGQPTNQECEVACGYHGDMQIELIDTIGDAPGPYNDFLATCPEPPVGGLYHHVMLEQGDYDVLVARMLAQGCTTAFDAKNGAGDRMCYLDATATTGGYIEIIESAFWPAVCAAMRQARAEWDGSNPVRSFSELLGDQPALVS
jgi:hypothetical protein